MPLHVQPKFEVGARGRKKIMAINKRVQANLTEIKLLYGQARLLSGSAGASITGSDFSSISRLATGSYQVVLARQYNSLKQYDYKLTSPSSGTQVTFTVSSTGSSVNTSEKSVNLCIRQASGSAQVPSGSAFGTLVDPNQDITVLIRYDLKYASNPN